MTRSSSSSRGSSAARKRAGGAGRPGPAAAVPRPVQRSEALLRWTIGLAVGAAFTWLAARSWPLDAVVGGSLTLEATALGPALVMRSAGGPVSWSASLLHLLGYFLVQFVIHAFRVVRWQPLVRPFAKVPLAILNRDGAIGFMGVFLLPLRLGELVRPVLLARDAGIPFGTGLSQIAVERIADGLVVTLLFFAVLVQVPAAALERAPEVQVGAYAALLVFAGATVALCLTAFARGLTIRLIDRTFGRLSGKLGQRLVGLLTAFVDGLRLLGSPLAVLGFLGLTAGYWLVNGAGYWLLGLGFGLQLSLVGAYAMMCTLVIGMMIPNSPGNVGSFWYFVLLPAGLFGVDGGSPRAVVFALALWAIQLLQVTLFGLWGLWARGRWLARGG